MRQYIKKLQSKSVTSRKQIFAGIMVFSMVIVGSVWVYSLGGRLDTKVKEQAREDIKPFKLFANSLSTTYKNISASVGNAEIPKIKKPASSVGKERVVEEKQIDLILVEEENPVQ